VLMCEHGPQDIPTYVRISCKTAHFSAKKIAQRRGACRHAAKSWNTIVCLQVDSHPSKETWAHCLASQKTDPLAHHAAQQTNIGSTIGSKNPHCNASRVTRPGFSIVKVHGTYLSRA